MGAAPLGRQLAVPWPPSLTARRAPDRWGRGEHEGLLVGPGCSVEALGRLVGGAEGASMYWLQCSPSA